MRKLLMLLLLTSATGCISFNPTPEPTPPAQPITPPGVKNGWAQPEAFGLDATAFQLTKTANSRTPATVADKAQPDGGAGDPIAALAIRKPASRSTADVQTAGGVSKKPRVDPADTTEESDAGTSAPENTSAETHLPDLPTQADVAIQTSVHRLVNTKRIALDFEIKNLGPSGVSVVEVWYTRDGQHWQRQRTTTEVKPPIYAEIPGEGCYGFTLVARNGVGLGKRRAQDGDPAQVAVEVDLTRPVVRLTGFIIEGATAERRLVITWQATDKNLGEHPITLTYAERADGPWKPIAEGLENSGRYVWDLPSSAPLRFLLRVSATDLAGNVGVAQTPTPILMDQSQPEISIRTVEPANGPARR